MKASTTTPVSRMTRRRAKPGFEAEYAALLKGMLEASSHFPGYLSATVIPPDTESADQEFQIVQRFASQEDLDRWDTSEVRSAWHDRIQPVALSNPAYRLISGLEMWFSPNLVSSTTHPPRWKMTTVSWLGIFPTVAVCLGVIGPMLSTWTFLARTAVITALVAVLMSYVVMPRIARWMGWWLKPSVRR